MGMRTTSENDVREPAAVAGQARSGSPVRPGPATVVPAGTRPARPGERRDPARPGGRRDPSPLPAARPAVTGGAGRARCGSGALAVPTERVARRRRRVAGALAAVLVGVATLLVLAVSSPSAGPRPSLDPAAVAPAPTVVTVVSQGESLQDVARRVSPGADERAVAARIRELNGLATSAVPSGRPLVVPAASAP